MSILTQASLVLTPNAVKASKLYSIIPSNGNGDMTVVRATTATRVNSSGLIESVAANVPRLNYDGSCPSILVEPQETNLLLNSVWAGGGSLPTSWIFNFSTGTSTPVTSIKNTNVTAYRFVTSNTRQDISQTFAVALNSVNSFSVYVESITTAIPISQMLRVNTINTGVGTTVFLKNNVVVSSALNIEAGFTYSIVLTCTTAGDFQFRLGSGVNSNVTGNFVLSMPQLEVSSYSTSFIPTTIQAITRNADVISKTGISDLIGQTQGVLFIESAALFNDLTQRGISISDSTNLNRITIFYHSTSNNILVTNLSNNVTIFQLSYTITDTTQFAKIAIRYSNTLGASLWVNGVNRASTVNTTLPASFNRLGFDTVADRLFFGKLKQVHLYKTYLTDTEMANLTTL